MNDLKETRADLECLYYQAKMVSYPFQIKSVTDTCSQGAKAIEVVGQNKENVCFKVSLSV